MGLRHSADLTQAILVVGTITDGFQFIGPFENAVDAEAWAENEFEDVEWWVATLEDAK